MTGSFVRYWRSAIIPGVWSLKYCLLIFISVLGVIQLAAARNNLRGLYFLPWKRYTAALGLVGIVFSLFVFFTWDEMNSRIIEGSQQTGRIRLVSGHILSSDDYIKAVNQIIAI